MGNDITENLDIDQELKDTVQKDLKADTELDVDLWELSDRIQASREPEDEQPGHISGSTKP